MSEDKKQAALLSGDTWIVQDTIQGLDKNGLTRMVNVRATSYEEYKTLMIEMLGVFKEWKALPVRSFGGGGKPQDAPKDIKSWADVPSCPEHKTKLYPKAWEGHPGMFFWNCPGKTNGEWCKSVKGMKASQVEYDAFQKLDPEDRPRPEQD